MQPFWGGQKNEIKICGDALKSELDRGKTFEMDKKIYLMLPLIFFFFFWFIVHAY